MKYHPDQNKGDKAAEEKFKSITQAYTVPPYCLIRRRSLIVTLGSLG